MEKAAHIQISEIASLKPIVEEMLDLKRKIDQLQYELKEAYQKLLRTIIEQKRFDLLQIIYKEIMKEV